MQLEYKEHQQQAGALFKSQEQAILDQPDQAAAGKQSVVAVPPVQAAAVTQAESGDLSEEEPEDLALSEAKRQLLDYHLVATTPLPTLIPESSTVGQRNICEMALPTHPGAERARCPLLVIRE